MKSYLYVVTVVIVLILCCGCTGASSSPASGGSVATTSATTTGTPLPTPSAAITPSTAQVQDYTFVQTITYANQNGTSVITKNKLAKTAEIEMTLKVETPTGVDEATYHKLMTGVTTKLMQMAFFNETALNEFNAQVEAWNNETCTIQDDSPADQRETTPGDNPLAGYTVQRVSIHLVDKESGAAISDAVITGPGEGDVSIAHH